MKSLSNLSHEYRFDSENIVQANAGDANDVMNLISDVVCDLRGKSIYQWDNQYPSLETVLRDIQKNDLYIYIENSSIGGAISINDEQEDEYSTIAWNDNGKVLCIHRLVVHPQFQGRGIGKKLLQFALEHAIRNEYTSVRLDAYSGNLTALNFYERSGFERAGELNFPRRDLPFICLEKKL